MSTADNSGHRLAPLLLAVLVACAPDRTSVGPSRAELLARSQQLDSDPAAALATLPALIDPAIARRRAELMDRLGRTQGAHDEIVRAFGASGDVTLLEPLRLYAVSLAARRADSSGLFAIFAGAPITEHPALAHRAAADAPLDRLTALALASPELARAAGDRLEESGGPAAALEAREHIVLQLPDDADAWDALARSRIAADKIDGALAAWDRAAALAPAQETFRVAPVRALVLAKLPDRAKQRATSLATSARAAHDVEQLLAASAAASAIDPELASALALEAQVLRPTDGRVAFIAAQRLAEAGDRARAARAYANLLVCGAHGRAWHRHEVAARLEQLGADGRAAIEEKPSCEPVDPADLATYTTALRANP